MSLTDTSLSDVDSGSIFSNSSDSIFSDGRRNDCVFCLCLSSAALVARADWVCHSCMGWFLHATLLLHEGEFDSMYWMLFESFNCLVTLLSLALTVDYFQSSHAANGEEAIIPKLRVHCALRYISGGSFHDVRSFSGRSKASFYQLLWHTSAAIISCEELAILLPLSSDALNHVRDRFCSISTDSITNGCAGDRWFFVRD